MSHESTTPETGTARVKRGMAEMLKGGVIMDVVTPEQARIAEAAGAVAVIIGFSNGGFPLALIVAGLYVVVNQFESNLIYPLIVKKIVGIPPLLVIVALIAGYTLAGFLGVVLSVPVAAVVLEFINDFDKRKRRAHA